MRDVNFYNNFNIVSDLLKGLSDDNPNLLDDEVRALSEIFIYVSTLQIDIRELKLQVSRWRSETNKLLIKQNE